MKKVLWEDRLPGDIFLYHGSGVLSAGIRMAELQLHKGAPEDFVPSHAGICWQFDEVVEALLDIEPFVTINSVAAVGSAQKYLVDASEGRIELWRPAPKISANLSVAVANYVLKYAPMKYGALNLVGFEWEAIVKSLFHVDIVNPISEGIVCSQGAMICLGDYIAPLAGGAEDWAHEFAKVESNIADCDPLQLRLLFLAHEDK